MSEDHLDEFEHYNYDPPIHSGASGKGLSKKEKIGKEQASSHNAREARMVENQITNAEQKQKEKVKKQTSKD